jgi:hypothetical protein
VYRLRCAREGRERDGLDERSRAGLPSWKSGATVYLYEMQAFALAITVHYTASEVARWLYRKMIAVSTLGVFIDTSLSRKAFNPSFAPILSRFSGTRYASCYYQRLGTQCRRCHFGKEQEIAATRNDSDLSIADLRGHTVETRRPRRGWQLASGVALFRLLWLVLSLRDCAPVALPRNAH